MLKILQARLQQYVNQELSDIQAGFRKSRRTRDQIANILWIIEKARELKKKSPSASLTTLKPLTVWMTINCGKFLKRWEYQITSLVSWETCMQARQQQLELDMEQQTDSKLGKEYKAVYHQKFVNFWLLHLLSTTHSCLWQPPTVLCISELCLSLVFLSSTESEIIWNFLSLPDLFQKNQFFSVQPSLWSNSHMCTWLLEKP